MKAYGVPRVLDTEFPDCADIKTYVMKSCVGTFKGKGGDYRGCHKNKQSKANARRFWKKRARNAAKRELNDEQE